MYEIYSIQYQVMSENKEELRIVTNLCDLVYEDATSQSRLSTIHHSQIKGRLSSVPNASKLYKKNRRTIDLKGWREEQYPIVCSKYRSNDMQKQMQYTFHSNQPENRPKIAKVKISQLKGLSTITTKRSNPKQLNHTEKIEKMLGIQSGDCSKKENKKGYQKQKQRMKERDIKLSNFFSKYDRVDSYERLQKRVDSLRGEIIQRYSTKFRLLKDL